MHIIFDFTGTLVNSYELQLETWRKILNQYELSENFDKIQHGIKLGLSSYEIIERIISEPNLINEIVVSKRNYFDNLLITGGKLFLNEKVVLERLTKIHRLSIVSLANVDLILRWINKCKLDNIFSNIKGRTSLNNRVSKEQLIRTLIKKYKNELTLFVGDTIIDYDIAKSLDILFALQDIENKYEGNTNNIRSKISNNFFELEKIIKEV